MSWGLVAIAGATIIGGVSASKAASKSAKAQGKSTDASIAEQRRQFDITQQNLAPFQSAGADALNQQRILLGLGGTDPDAQRRSDLQSQLDAINQEEQAFADKFGGKITGRGGMINRVAMKISNNQGFGGQRDKIQSQIDALGSFSPGNAQEQQQAAFNALNQSPGQQFLRDRAQKNLLRNASAIGGLGGGNVRSALVQQGVGFAQQDLQNQFGRLGQLAGQGQNAATTIGQFGQQTSGNIGNALIAGGNARASGIINQSNAFQNTLGGLANVAGQFFNKPTTGV